MTIPPVTRTGSIPTVAPRRRRIVGAAGAAVAAAVTLLPMTSAVAGPPPVPADTHCPAAYPLLAIDSFDPVYQSWLHTVVDLNGDGYVCAKRQPDAMATALGVTPPGFPIYLATDNSIVQRTR